MFSKVVVQKLKAGFNRIKPVFFYLNAGTVQCYTTHE